ncbi:MAG TPA: RidA family protein [Candidatus Dormibacteraeota bacterium]|jgi:enamine deaminase RidA (YjgF/YER057c/UK114 family)|nr:RidA family protein [Candidatus Dormibacteraeota bacterium]
MGRVELVNTEGLRAAVGFSHVALAADTAWISGQLATDAQGEIESPGDIAAQAGAVFRNLAAALESVGCDPSDVIRMTYYVTDIGAYRSAGTVIGRRFEQVFGEHRPAATVVGVTELIHSEAMLQVDCTARAPEQRQRKRNGKK